MGLRLVCRLARIADREQRKHRLMETEPSRRRTLCVILPSTLSHRMACLKSKTPHTFTRRRADELEQKGFGFDESKWFPTKDCGRCSRALDGSDLLGGSDGRRQQTIISLIATTSTLFASFKNQVGFILKLMSGSTPSLNFR
jgi:hypothetical protein